LKDVENNEFVATRKFHEWAEELCLTESDPEEGSLGVPQELSLNMLATCLKDAMRTDEEARNPDSSTDTDSNS